MGAIGLYCHTRYAIGHSDTPIDVEVDINDLVPRTVLHIVVIGRIILIGNRHIGCLAQGAEVQLNLDGLGLVLGNDVTEVGVVVLARNEHETQRHGHQAQKYPFHLDFHC